MHARGMDPTDKKPARTVDAALRDLLARSKVLKLATAGGPVSPWITSTYFVEDGPARVHLILERTGKGMANVRANPRVAIAVDDANPFAIFAQAEGSARVLDGDEAERRLSALRKKVPEIEPLLKAPSFVVEIAVARWLVTSFPDGWFPAKELRPAG